MYGDLIVDIATIVRVVRSDGADFMLIGVRQSIYHAMTPHEAGDALAITTNIRDLLDSLWTLSARRAIPDGKWKIVPMDCLADEIDNAEASVNPTRPTPSPASKPRLPARAPLSNPLSEFEWQDEFSQLGRVPQSRAPELPVDDDVRDIQGAIPPSCASMVDVAGGEMFEFRTPRTAEPGTHLVHALRGDAEFSSYTHPQVVPLVAKDLVEACLRMRVKRIPGQAVLREFRAAQNLTVVSHYTAPAEELSSLTEAFGFPKWGYISRIRPYYTDATSSDPTGRCWMAFVAWGPSREEASSLTMDVAALECAGRLGRLREFYPTSGQPRSIDSWF